ncbi:MAG: toll/interleukin-1 receptor domain-containing protein [Lachnospiraceae bacterium]|nr:toll/interleukin-1 receptor domain-containing protein [Lachnospiraceae bacterium]
MIPAYNGPEPFIFVSYAHKDSAEVYGTIEKLSSLGYRIWYDEGIKPGVEWPENIAEHLDKCSLFMMFISPNSMASANCRREINFALSRSKKFLCIILTKTEIPLGMELQLASQQSIFRYKYSSEEAYIYKICSAAGMANCKEKHFFENGDNDAVPGIASSGTRAAQAGDNARASALGAKSSDSKSAAGRKRADGGKNTGKRTGTAKKKVSKAASGSGAKKGGGGTVFLGILIGGAIIVAFIAYMLTSGSSSGTTSTLSPTPSPSPTPTVTVTPAAELTLTSAPTTVTTQQTQIPGGTSTQGTTTGGGTGNGQTANNGNNGSTGYDENDGNTADNTNDGVEEVILDEPTTETDDFDGAGDAAAGGETND